MWHIHAMEYYSVLKKEGHADTCHDMNKPSDMMPSEINQSPRDKCDSACVTQLEWASSWRRRIEQGCPGAGEAGVERACVAGRELPFGVVKNILDLGGGGGGVA